jgi:hypothetical protein
MSQRGGKVSVKEEKKRDKRPNHSRVDHDITPSLP